MEFGQKSDPFREVIEFVEQLYSELAQNKSNFSDYSCLFCRSEYMDLNLLLYHIEDYHRNQILDGTFNLQQNFEELIKKKIGTVVKEEQPEQRTLESNQLYQCAKCKVTHSSVRAITEHVNQCSVSIVQSVVRSTNFLAPAPQPPPNPNLYGCARCGSRFKLVRQLVVHLHSCFVDCFHDKHRYLLPNLWVEAPNNQHIVINESETNTTLNTTGLWLMSNSPTCTTEDNLSKGFWVMPPSNVQPIEIQPIQQQVIQPQPAETMVVVPSTHQMQQHPQLQQQQQQQQHQQMRYVKIEDEIFMVDDTTNTKLIQNTNNVIVRPTTTADENKRKRGRVVQPTLPPLVQTNSVYRQQPTYVNKKPRTDTNVPSAAQTQIVYISPPSKVPPKPVPPLQPQQRKIPQKPSVPSPAAMQQSTYIQQPPAPPLVSDQLYIEEPTNYVITYDDNTTQIIKPGDELYEQVASSFQYEQSEFQMKKENTIDVTSHDSASPNVIDVGGLTPNNNAIQSPVASPIIDCNIDDLSHLDMPIVTKTNAATIMRRKNEDAFIKSYTSFLESRQITPKT
ncbi:hypothetical protein HA402_015093 [Bradysia odoriphaga]|nr:hypothetical protein HA402_015093 [Bradysia odoriphaga]